MDYSEKAMAPHSSTLAWQISRMEEPGRLQSMGSQRVGQDWATSLSLVTFMHQRRKRQPTPVLLPGESQAQWSLVGCRLWGCTVGDDWSDLAAAAAVRSPGWRRARGGHRESSVQGCFWSSTAGPSLCDRSRLCPPVLGCLPLKFWAPVNPRQRAWCRLEERLMLPLCIIN